MVKRKVSKVATNPYIKRCRRAAKAKRTHELAARTEIGEESEESGANSSAEAVKSIEKNRLLSLPVGVRNIIYKFAIGDWQAEYESYKRTEISPLLGLHTQVTAQSARLNLYPPLPTEADYALYLCMKRDWLALGQTSRQLREEFRLLQCSVTHVYMSILSLKKYLETFHSVPSSNQTITTRPADYPTKLTVFFDKFDKKQLRPFDVLPLMRLLQRDPSLLCDVWTLNPGTDGYPPEPHIVEDRSIHDAVFAAQNSLRAHPNPGFLSSLDRMSFSPHGTLSIHVKDKFLQDWMKKDQERPWAGTDWGRKSGKGINRNGTWVKERKQHTRKYLEASGMGVNLLEKWKVTVGEGAG